MNSNFSLSGHVNTPKGLQLDHEDARAELVRAISMSGRIGEAAKNIARVCLPHFEYEEKFVFPVFGMLPDLAAGKVRPEMAEALPLINGFNAWHDTFNTQHESLGTGINALLSAACKENNREVIEFGYRLRAHERMEHEVIYPPVLAIGKFVQERFGLYLPHCSRS